MTSISYTSSRRLRLLFVFFFFSSRRRHTRFDCDWSSDVCSSDLVNVELLLLLFALRLIFHCAVVRLPEALKRIERLLLDCSPPRFPLAPMRKTQDRKSVV